jgi:hypothetical protein
LRTKIIFQYIITKNIEISGGKSSFNILGNYVLEYNLSSQTNTKIPVNLSDPVQLDYSIHELSKNVGVKFKFIFLHAFIDYTFQEYDVISVGASINFR